MRQLALAYQPDATALFAPFIPLPRAILLHSADRSSRFGRYDIVTAAPSTEVTYAQGELTIGARTVRTQHPLKHLQALLAERRKTRSTVPFSSGFAGYLGYELHQGLEQQQSAPPAPVAIPQLWGGLYDWSLVTDHRLRCTTLYSPDAQTQARVLAQLAAPSRQPQPTRLSTFEPSLSRADYRHGFAQAQAYISAGDCYQVNFARHFKAQLQGNPFDLYRHWLTRQPAPFSAYLSLAADSAIVSLSPERFVSLTGQRASVSPIKGTRGRRSNPGKDALARLVLLRSDKDRAENLMIVDLLRNDLGRVSKPGSVAVTHLFEPVTFANVHHLVSTIESQLQPGVDPVALIAALFPCGSVTGAPKIRAIDIINELEPVGRSVYCGSIGYIDDGGNADLSVAIRTGVVAAGEVHLWGGGGLVADSRASREEAEITEKIGRLLRTSDT